MQTKFFLRPIARNIAIGAAVFGLALPSGASAQSTGTTAVDAGPIWNQADAEKKCPEVAKANGGAWTGQWRTTVPGKMSVCELQYVGKPGKYVVKSVDAGPIWNQAYAEKKCPEVAKANGGTWTGQWRTTVPGTMSVCELRLPRPKS
jgi:Mannan-binding protein